MKLNDVLETTMGKVTIVVYGFDEHAHITSTLTIFKGYSHEAINQLPPLERMYKVCGLMADNNELLISCYDAVDTEQLGA